MKNTNLQWTITGVLEPKEEYLKLTCFLSFVILVVELGIS